MRLRHIEVFNAVMLTGSVSAAARLINVTQPAVSRILAHAELQLGFPLFHRLKGKLVPTTEAQTLYPHIERLFTQLDDVQRLANSLKGDQREGELHILSVLALSYEVLPRALRFFRQKHPDVKVTIDALHSPQIVSALVLQEADVGFVFSAIAHPALTQEHLADGRMVCVAPKGMLGAALVDAGVAHLADLADTPVVRLDVRDPIGTVVSHACREAGVGLQTAITVQTYHAALALAHHGHAVAVVDTCTAASADRSKVDVLALAPHIAVPIKSLRTVNRPSSLLASAMTQCMRQAVAETLEKVYTYFPRLKTRRSSQAAYTSGGEQQMCAIGRALMANPSMVLLDEPSMGLAPQIVEEVFNIVKDLNTKEKVTFLLAEQNTNMALKYSDYGYIMESGRVVMDGAASDLANNEDVKEFYLGVGGGERKSFKDVKSYKRRKRWLA